MATVTKPIALDESIHTTEQTPRNIADVLAEELAGIAQSIGAINQKYKIVQTLPDTDISTTAIYLVPKSTAQTDNTYDEYINLTGTSLGWEKIGDTEIDLSDYYTESEVDALLAEKANVSDIPVLPTADEQTSTTGEFETVTGGLLSECIVSIEPVQDLHGYDKPWVGGAGKNKLAPYAVSSITTNGITFKTNADGSVTITGTATANAYLNLILWETLLSTSLAPYAGQSVILSGGTSQVRFTLSFRASSSATPIDSHDTGSGATATIPSDTSYQTYCALRVLDGQTVNTTVYPMVRLSTESDATFEPYENICPITGHTQADVFVVGKNKLPLPVAETKNGVTLTHNSDGSITLTGTASANTYFDFFPNGDFNSSKYSGYKVYLNNSGVSPSVNTVSFRISGSDRVSLQTIAANGTAINTSGDGLYFSIRVQGGYDTNGCTFKPMMIAPDETDTTFEPYKGKTYSTPFGQTVYGGTLDLVSGVLKIDKGYFKSNIESDYVRIDAIRYHVRLSAVTDSIRDGYVHSCISNKFKTFTTVTGAGICFINTTGAIRFDTVNEYTDVASMLADIGEIEFVYPLATPQTIQLTPQQVVSLVGKNYVDAPLDGQSIVEVKFKQLMTIDDVLALIGG